MSAQYQGTRYRPAGKPAAPWEWWACPVCCTFGTVRWLSGDPACDCPPPKVQKGGGK